MSTDNQLDEQQVREIFREEISRMHQEQGDDLDADTAKAASLLTRRELLAGVAGGTAASVGVLSATDAAKADSSQAGKWGTAANPGDFYSDDHFANNHAAGGLSTPPSGYLNFGFEDGTPRYLDAAGNVRDLTPFTDGDADGVYTLPSTTDGISVASTDTDTLTGADVANAASGTVPKAQGDGTLAMETIAAGMWAKDTTATISGNTSITLSQSYSQVKVLIQEATHDDKVAMRCNGYSTANHDTAFVDGTTTTDWNQIQLNPDIAAGNTTAGMVDVFSTASGMVFAPALSANFNQQGVAAAGWNGDTTGSISSVQLRFPNDTTTGGTVEVFGR